MNADAGPVLRSERLLLRPLTAADEDLGRALLMDPEVMEHLGGAYTEERLLREMAVATRRCAQGAIGVWCVLDFESDQKLGTGVLLPLPIEEDDTNWNLVAGEALPDVEIEVGYLLKTSAWGKGFATEICRRLVRFAFEGTALEEVVACTGPNNVASQRVLRKAGLSGVGMRKAYASIYPGFRITRKEWLGGAGKPA